MNTRKRCSLAATLRTRHTRETLSYDLYLHAYESEYRCSRYSPASSGAPHLGFDIVPNNYCMEKVLILAHNVMLWK